MGVRFFCVWGILNDVGIILLFWACTICIGQLNLYMALLFIARAWIRAYAFLFRFSGQWALFFTGFRWVHWPSPPE
jgi:hypothetical protein